MKEQESLSRRKFLSNSSLIGAAGVIGVSQIISACGRKGAVTRELFLPPLLEEAPDGKLLKAGVVGCGGRGTGAAINFLNAGPNLEVTALADVFQDNIDACRTRLKEQMGVEVADENCFIGFDAYKNVIDAGVDIVILATPPYFRPEHFQACVDARKHVFMEKPVAVDPVGVRTVIAAAKRAESIGLTVVTGTQRRHQRDYIETFRKVAGEGAIGKIVSANAYWNQSKLWHRDRNPEWNDMEFMLRDWVNWSWLSGDHIVEQHVHNIDIVNWFAGKFPVKAVGFGARHRRVTGDLYDMFSTDFVYDDEVHMHSMCRQINGCSNNVSEYIRGTEGYTNCRNTIFDLDGNVTWEYAYPVDEDGQLMKNVKISPYDQEHIDMVTAIRTDQSFNEAEDTAKSTLTGIMGRISAYTGKEVTWDEMMNSDLKLGPEEIKFGDVRMEFPVPVPGEPAA
ncbi:MAG: Gfo/Idh/MocA family protein [Bacteroidota bacterium]